jgi:hypothetical protein
VSEKPRLPIVYVRGFAGDTAGIDRAVTDPFYGFNDGSTHIRVGEELKPVFYQFESPLLRLHLDEGYSIFVEGGQMAYLDSHDSIDPASIWIHRFYDVSASTWGAEPREFDLERAAEDLLGLIEKLQAKTGAPRVQLVAHSMGGLICRCLLQKIIPEQRPGRTGTDFVDKVFTYGTPHGGIRFEAGFGLFEKLRDTFGIHGADVFGPERMHMYLTPAGGGPSGERGDGEGGADGEWQPGQMPDEAFPRERMLCLIGTNPEDYDVAAGLSSAVVGARSDGLVQIENAYVPGAHRAYVHRSHSGRYGLVNSEEGYQNLRRFLFGDVKVQADLVGHTLPSGGDGGDHLTWQAEVRLSVRGLPVTLDEKTAAHWCPLQLSPVPGREQGQAQGQGQEADGDGDGACVPLATAFLSSSSSVPRPEGAGADTLRYVLNLRILSLREHDGLFSFLDHVEQTADFDDTLIIDVRNGQSVPGELGVQGAGAGADAGAPGSAPSVAPRVWPAWNSRTPGAIRDHEPAPEPLGDEDPEAGKWVAHVPLPESAEPILGSGARIRLTAEAWG